MKAGGDVAGGDERSASGVTKEADGNQLSVSKGR